MTALTQDGDGVLATLQHAGGAPEQCRAGYVCRLRRHALDGACRHSASPSPAEHTSTCSTSPTSSARGPAVDGELHVDLDEADLLAVFAMKGAGRVRLVGTVRGDAGAAERNELELRRRSDASARASAARRSTSVNWFSTYRVHHRVASRFREGRAFLLGDAAHVHSPVGAQGMNTGIGDAVNLAWKLAAVLQGESPPTLLDTYEPERIAFARRLVATTDRVLRDRVEEWTSRRAAFGRARSRPSSRSLFRLRAARRFLFRTVSQIGDQLSRQPAERGAGGLGARRRSPALGAESATGRTIQAAHVTSLAGPRLW